VVDLATDYMGLRLRNPLVAAACPISQTVAGIRRLADSGVAAVVVFSLFEEQLRPAGDAGAAQRAGAGGSPAYLPPVAESLRPQEYLRLLEQAAAAVDIPIIGSLNGVTPGGWARYAQSMQQAGASAIELNMYWLPGSAQMSGPAAGQRHVEVLARVKEAVTVPVAVKLSPHLVPAGEVALSLDAAGVDGLVLFNRFLQPDIDPDTLTVVPTLDLSAPAEGRLPRTWIALLRNRVHASLAGTTGVEDSADVVKYLLAGADVVMTASALLRHGPEHAGRLLQGVAEWMAVKEFESVSAMRGLLSVPPGADDSATVRTGYVNVLETAKFSYSRW
jgi:dihydroorotate dehydrogenase (fumarate)